MSVDERAWSFVGSRGTRGRGDLILRETQPGPAPQPFPTNDPCAPPSAQGAAGSGTAGDSNGNPKKHCKFQKGCSKKGQCTFFTCLYKERTCWEVLDLWEYATSTDFVPYQAKDRHPPRRRPKGATNTQVASVITESAPASEAAATNPTTSTASPTSPQAAATSTALPDLLNEASAMLKEIRQLGCCRCRRWSSTQWSLVVTQS